MKRQIQSASSEETKTKRRRKGVNQTTSPINDRQSFRDQAERYRLITAKFPIDALTPVWKTGVNRQVKEGHVQKLCQRFKDIGIFREDPIHRLLVLCTKSEVDQMKAHLSYTAGTITSSGNEDAVGSGEAQARESCLPSFQDWEKIGNE